MMIEVLSEACEETACSEIDTLSAAVFNTAGIEVNKAGRSQNVSKNTVAKHFSAASGQYDRYAQVQKQIAQVNLELLNKVRAGQHAAYSVDLGCGTGIHTKTLAAMSENCLAIDISLGMLETAKRNHAETTTAANKKIQYCTGDADSLPLQSGTVDIVHSSMALQWCSSPNIAFDEIARVLSKNGSAQLAIMLDSSLHELRQAWDSLGIASRVNQFFTQQQWLEASEQLSAEQADKNAAGQFNIQYRVEQFTEWHKSSLHMLRALKRIGAATKNNPSYVNSGLNTSAMAASVGISKQELRALDREMYQQLHAENLQECSEHNSSLLEQGLPLSYQVLFLSIHKS